MIVVVPQCNYMLPLTGSAYINRLRGPMARRLTTNQEIPGSTPGVIIVLSSGDVVECLFAGGGISGCYTGVCVSLSGKTLRVRGRLRETLGSTSGAC